MNHSTDQQLLREYAERRLEAAFTELVRRHVDFVHSAALRMVRDAHLAEDVTQAVFGALAKDARQLVSHPTLEGWLHSTTRNLAANVIRAEIRQRNRAQEAAIMNELLSTGVDANWEHIAPHLDEALSELNEPERDALLLRYFKNQDFRTVGKQLGVSDDTAQKRVSRAVEKLRDFFSKRKITVGASGLVVLISTNAVQSAPIGLVATISAAVLTGTTISTSTAIATTKVIAMTTLQKTLVTATVAVLAGAGIYEAKQAHDARAEVQTLQQQQAPLTEQIQQFQRERDDATNRLADLLAENARLRTNPNEMELLKLRGQAGVLRQQLAFMQAKMSLPSSGLEKMMADPAMKEMVDQQARREIKLRYADLFRELKLSPEQIEQFALTYANSGLHQTDVEGQLRSLLGDDGYARFKEFTQEIPARTTVELLNSQLGASQLTDEQDARLLQIVKAEPYDLTYGIEGDLSEAFFGAQDQIDNYVRQVVASNQRVVQQAGAFLAPDQLATLNTVLTNALSARIAQGAALAQKH